MVLVPMRQTDSSMHEINGFDLVMKERRPAQQLAHWADDIGDVQVARGDFVQHRSEEEKIVLIDERDVYVDSATQRPFEFECSIHPAESTAEYQHAGFAVRHNSAANADRFRGVRREGPIRHMPQPLFAMYQPLAEPKPVDEGISLKGHWLNSLTNGSALGIVGSPP